MSADLHFSLSERPNRQRQASRRWLLTLAACACVGASVFVAIAQVATPAAKLTTLADTPLYAAGAAAQKPTLTLALSVEYPTTGAANRGDYVDDDATKYLGYFDNASCYDYTGGVFVRKGAWVNRSCSGAGYSGNFMNWATASSIDILRLALTGGDRIVDDQTQTILQRAYLRDSFFNNPGDFPKKTISNKSIVAKVLPASEAKADGSVDISNCKNRVFFNATACSATAGREVKIKVCESSGGTLSDPRLLLCKRYPNAQFKPIGSIQKYSDNVRLAAFGYLNDTTQLDQLYGGVLRAPMKWVGPTAYDKDGGALAGLNPNREWEPDTGIFRSNPDNRSENISGVINYLNQFGRLGSQPGNYKVTDPVGELYYEALRYLQGLAPTSQAIPSSLTDELKGGFPVYSDWTGLDPYKDGTSTGDYSCIRNNIFTVGDAKTHADWSLPGNTQTSNSDFSRVANLANNEPNFKSWANVVGGFESGGSVSYDFTPQSTDGGATQPPRVTTTTSNPNTAPLPGAGLSGLGSLSTGYDNKSSYLIVGAAYWAATHDIRGTTWTGSTALQRPGMRVKTYMLDVNENSESSTLSTRQKNVYFLSAKYGGFIDQSGIGNPFKNKAGTLDNSIWSNTLDGKGDPKNYFLASSGQAVLDAVDAIFAGVAAEGNNIAGAALSSNSIAGNSSGVVRLFNTRFNGSNWSGNVIAREISKTADGGLAVAAEDGTNAWNAEGKLQTIAPSSRNIVLGDRTDAGTVSAVDLPSTWNALPDATRRQMANGTLSTLLGITGSTLSTLIAEVGSNPGCSQQGVTCSTDTSNLQKLGTQQLRFLRGEKTNSDGTALAGSSTQIAGKPFTIRARTNLLGDIVNSVATFSGAPTRGLQDAGYSTFYTANKDRDASVFVGANDGMLHAFNAATGAEQFAYIPSWMSRKLPALADSRYGASSDVPHQPYVDAPPAVGEAKVGDGWKTVLISGTGGGGQGVFALDVTNPAAFNKNKVMWEFTDKDDPTLGNVIGRPQIHKIKVAIDSTTKQPMYKWFAVVSSGVNNYALDGSVANSPNQAIFLLDLSKSLASAWVENTNYFKLNIPADSSLNAYVAPGVVEFSVKGGFAGDLSALYAGDLHGQLWRIDYETQFSVSKSISSTVVALNTNMNSGKPLFKTATTSLTFPDPSDSAKTVTKDVPQPISAAPALIAGPKINGASSVVVMVGSGKYLELSDNQLSATTPRQSIYAVLDDGSLPISQSIDPSKLKAVTFNGTALVSGSFVWGPYKIVEGTVTQYPGWKLDFATPQNQGERQVSRVSTFGTTAVFNSLIPPGGAANPCASTGSRAYQLDLSTGAGAYSVSTVGNLSAPILALTAVTTGSANNAGGNDISLTGTSIAVGKDGLKVDKLPSYSTISGPVSWRLIENYKQLKANANSAQGQ